MNETHRVFQALDDNTVIAIGQGPSAIEQAAELMGTYAEANFNFFVGTMEVGPVDL